MGRLIRGFFILAIVAVGAIVLLYMNNETTGVDRPALEPSDRPAAKESSKDIVDPARARDRAADVGETAARAVNRAGTAIDDAALTAKIKSKMVLDDLVKARDINVDTSDGVVTLQGTVHSEKERQRALDLVRQTDGVRDVKDRLVIQRVRSQRNIHVTTLSYLDFERSGDPCCVATPLGSESTITE